MTPGGEYSIFFDVSELSNSAPLPDKVRKSVSEVATQLPVPDAAFVSRFPLRTVQAKNAIEAARIIRRHLAQAQAEGWTVGNALADC